MFDALFCYYQIECDIGISIDGLSHTQQTRIMSISVRHIFQGSKMMSKLCFFELLSKYSPTSKSHSPTSKITDISKIFPQKIYFEISVACYKRKWNENKSMNCLKGQILRNFKYVWFPGS